MSNLLNAVKSIPVSIQRRGGPLLSFQQELARTVSDLSHCLGLSNFQIERFESLSLIPAIDIIDDKDSFKVEVEISGMDEDDVKVSIGDGMLTIKGEKKVSKQNKDKNYIMREISYGNYERSIALPDSVDVAQAKASFKKGMLWIHIPKKPESARRSRDILVEKA